MHCDFVAAVVWRWELVMQLRLRRLQVLRLQVSEFWDSWHVLTCLDNFLVFESARLISGYLCFGA